MALTRSRLRTTLVLDDSGWSSGADAEDQEDGRTLLDRAARAWEREEVLAETGRPDRPGADAVVRRLAGACRRIGLPVECQVGTSRVLALVVRDARARAGAGPALVVELDDARGRAGTSSTARSTAPPSSSAAAGGTCACSPRTCSPTPTPRRTASRACGGTPWPRPVTTCRGWSTWRVPPVRGSRRAPGGPGVRDARRRPRPERGAGAVSPAPAGPQDGDREVPLEDERSADDRDEGWGERSGTGWTTTGTCPSAAALGLRPAQGRVPDRWSSAHAASHVMCTETHVAD